MDETDEEAIGKWVLDFLRRMTPDERVSLISDLGDIFCVHCGQLFTEDSPVCYCTRDD